MNKCSISECLEARDTKGYCKKHYLRFWRHGDPHIIKKAENGMGHINSEGYRIIAGKYEHRTVMEGVLGRELLPGENVHHKNGIRHDNTPENLELWVEIQPTGQRVEDLVKLAKTILETYTIKEEVDDLHYW